MFDGMERLLQEVRYIPELKRNLIYLGMLEKSGNIFKSKSGTLRVAKGSLIVMKGIIKMGLYTLVGKIVIGEASPVQNRKEDKVRLWHLRLGHISQKGLQELQKQGLPEEERLGELPYYEDCIFGKATRVSFKLVINQTKQILDYIHSNLWGLAMVNSHGG
ncbi:hypothetical protein F2P56_033970, partial [Juglans regia]